MSITGTQFSILGVITYALTGLFTWPVRAFAVRSPMSRVKGIKTQ